MEIHCRQMRPSNTHIAYMAACQGPKRKTTAQLAQQGRQDRRQCLPRPKDNCQSIHTTTNTSDRQYVQATAQTAIPSAAINRNACRHKGSDPLSK